MAREHMSAEQRGVTAGRQGEEDEEEGATETTGRRGETRKGGHPSEHGERGATRTGARLLGEDLHSQNKTPRRQPSTEEIPSQQYTVQVRVASLLAAIMKSTEVLNPWHGFITRALV